MRSEEFERIRRRAFIEFEECDPASRPKHWFDPNVPWDGVFAKASKDKEFWDCLLYTSPSPRDS